MARIGWYLKRIRVMSAPEIIYRLWQEISLISMRIGNSRIARRAQPSPALDPMQLRFCRETEPRLPLLPFDTQRLGQLKDLLMRGETRVAGRSWQWEDSPDIWRRAPDTGQTWPIRFFDKIGYREGNPYGDVRLVWEPSRLQHLVDLAILARTGCTAESRQAARMVSAQLSSWVKCNPPLSGPHYISSMECSLRMIAACHAMDMLRNMVDEVDAWDALVAMVSSHAAFIERRLSRHSSSGNHTVAEAAGLIYAGMLFPEMEHSNRWVEHGLVLLSDCANKQVLPDGGGVEQALWYHYFNIQIMSLISELLQYYGQTTPTDISAALKRGTGFLVSMGLGTEWLPPIGDADNGYALSRYLQLPDIQAKTSPEAQTFRNAGYTVACISQRARVTLVFDHGELGMPPAYGHGHADALNILLQADGEDVFVDPGTYTYTGDPIWRRYFRSTAAHNTVTVEGRDQAQQDGCFLWSRPFTTRLIAADTRRTTEGRLIAEHSGYHELGARHIRGVFWARDRWLLIRDIILGQDVAPLWLHWHLAKEPHRLGSQRLHLPLLSGSLELSFTGGFVSQHRGEREPPLGWRSAAYGQLEPITTIRVLYDGTLPHEFTTLVSLNGHGITEKALEETQEWMQNQAC